MFIKIIIPTIAIFIPSLIFGFIGKPTEMGLAIVAGSLTIAFVNIDKIESFKSGVFEAKMKEMKKVVDEAYATIDNLKEISIPLIISTLNTITYLGRLGGIGLSQKHNLKNDIEGLIKKFDIKDEKVKDILEDFYKQHTWDMFQYFTSEFLGGKSDMNEKNEKLNLMFDRKSTNYPSKEDILKALNVNENNLIEIEKEKLEDYLYYRANRKLRSDI